MFKNDGSVILTACLSVCDWYGFYVRSIHLFVINWLVFVKLLFFCVDVSYGDWPLSDNIFTETFIIVKKGLAKLRQQISGDRHRTFMALLLIIKEKITQQE